MSDPLAHLYALIDMLESDPAWPWPPMDRSASSKEEKMLDRYPHDPRDLAFADTIYHQLLITSADESEARERTYKHLVVVHQWQDDRALYASELAMEHKKER